MGTAFGKRRPEPPKPPRRRKPKVHQYLLGSVRPKSTHSWRAVDLLQRLGQEKSTFDSDSDQSVPGQSTTLPRWQSKWEIDMRPPPGEGGEIRPWHSMPLPTTDTAPALTKIAPLTRQALSRRGKKKGKTTRGRRISRVNTPLTDIEESEKFERISVSSVMIDGRKMIYKTDARTDSVIQMTAKLWQIEPKKANKQWFLGYDHKQDSQILEVVPPAPRNVKHFQPLVRHTKIFPTEEE